jgi:hypothetical protein
VQHADLQRVNADVVHHRADLGLQHFHRNAVNGGDTQRVLRGHGGDRGHAVAAQRAEGLEVGLNARATATVGAGNRQHTGIAKARLAWIGAKVHAENYRPRAAGVACIQAAASA